MKFSPVFVALIFGAMVGPAFAVDALMPAPVTDYSPPPRSTYLQPPPAVADETLPAASEAAPETELPASDSAAPPAPEPPPASQSVSCDNCAPPRRYDSIEVIKKIRDLDRSRSINTTADVAPTYAPRREHPGYRVRSDVTLVNFVVHHYRVIESPGLTEVSEGEYRPLVHRGHRHSCGYGRRDRYGSCGRPLLRVRG